MSSPTPFPLVPVVGRLDDQSPQTLRSQLSAWVDSEALAALVAGFGGALPEGSPAERLAWLDSFSLVWDYRGRNSVNGEIAERNQAAAAELTVEESELAMAAATALGLVVPNFPRHTEYDHVLVNGALVRYSIWRTAYAGLLLRGPITTRTVASLTAFRPLKRTPEKLDVDEPTLIREYGLSEDITDEASMMEFLLRREFGLGPLEVVHEVDDPALPRSRVSRIDKDGVSYAVVVAPGLSRQQRAKTDATMQFWALSVGNVSPGDRVLSISSAIYGPYQHADALRTLALPYGVEVDTVAIDFPAITALDHVPADRPFEPAQHLQEIRSTIRAYAALWNALDDDA